MNAQHLRAARLPALVLSGVLASIVAAFAATPDPATVHADFHYDRVRVADGITTFIEGPSHAPVQGNITLIAGDKAALVVDTGHFPAVARRVVADIRKLTDKPVKYVAVTHWHMDHYMGNAEFADAFPGLTIVTQNFTAPMMDKYGERYLGYAPKLEESLKPLRAMLASGKAADGTDVPPDRRERLATVVREVEAAKPEFELMRYRGADISFENEVDIDLGNRIVRLMHLGRGNTAGDLVAYVPDARVLIAGDTVVRPVPYMYGSHLGEWAAVERKLAELGATTIVPGHGEVMHDSAYLDEVRELLEQLVADVSHAWKPGMSADDVRKAIDLSAQREKFCHGDKALEANFKDSVETAGVDSIVQQLEGKPKAEGFPE